MVPGPPIEDAAGGLLAYALKDGSGVGVDLSTECYTGHERGPCAPLLEEERDAGGGALVTKGSSPFGMHRPGAGAGLAADDDPVQAAVHECVAVCSLQVDRTKQRFGGDEPDGGRCVDQGRDPDVGPFLVLDGYADPDPRRYADQNSELDSSDRSLAWRFVSSWNVCCGAAIITASTRATNSTGTWSWNRSDMELTNTRRGRRHRRGSVSRSGRNVGLNPLGKALVPANRPAMVSA